MKPGTGVRTDTATADAAIARVLHAERAALTAIESTRSEVLALAEDARRDTAARAQQTEQRCRHLAACFERDLVARLAAVEARQAQLTRPHALSAEEIEGLDAALGRLAREMIGAP